MTQEQIKDEQIRLLTALNNTKMQQAYYNKLCIHILQEANTLAKESLEAEQVYSAASDEERCALINKINENYACLEASKQALLSIQKLADKAKRKYNETEATYNRFCQRHNIENAIKLATQK